MPRTVLFIIRALAWLGVVIHMFLITLSVVFHLFTLQWAAIKPPVAQYRHAWTDYWRQYRASITSTDMDARDALEVLKCLPNP